MVYRKLDAFIAVEKPMNPRIRQSRYVVLVFPAVSWGCIAELS
jgi:hypothetical protein